MKRREFCRQLTIVGSTIIFSPLFSACQADAPPADSGGTGSAAWPTWTPVRSATPNPTGTAATADAPTVQPPTEEPLPTQTLDPTLENDVAYVALVKTSDRAVGVRRALELLAINPVRTLPVLLKPNLNSADPPPASTHPELLRHLVLALQEMGAAAITIGERSGMGNTRQVMRQTGVLGLAEELGASTIVFDELEEADWIVRRSNDFHWPDGIAVPRPLLDSPCVIQTCNLKTHGYGGHFTLSLKNSVGFVAKTVTNGGINYMEQLHGSDYQRQMIAEINTLYNPSLIVIDGVEAFATGGPATGRLVQPEVVLAGTDRIALDAVGVAILRLGGTTAEVSAGPVFAQEQIARAVELGLGVDSPAKIRFLTGDTASRAYAETLSTILQ